MTLVAPSTTVRPAGTTRSPLAPMDRIGTPCGTGRASWATTSDVSLSWLTATEVDGNPVTSPNRSTNAAPAPEPPSASAAVASSAP